ncbi:Dynein heavy chain 5, axonemal, partial [Halocaridina rubra]
LNSFLHQQNFIMYSTCVTYLVSGKGCWELQRMSSRLQKFYFFFGSMNVVESYQTGYCIIFDWFTSPKDVLWFEEALVNQSQSELTAPQVKLLSKTHYFVDFLRDAPEPTGDEGEDLDMEMPKVYEPIPSFKSLEERLQMFLAQYNEMIRGAGMDLVFFTDAMIHLIR